MVSTTVSVATRSIHVLREDGNTERYALARSRNGDVHWRHDVFGPRDETGQMPWIDYGGRLTVGQVLERVPTCSREIRRWTRDEIDLGPDDLDVDIFGRDTRRRALELLSAELALITADTAS